MLDRVIAVVCAVSAASSATALLEWPSVVLSCGGVAPEQTGCSVMGEVPDSILSAAGGGFTGLLEAHAFPQLKPPFYHYHARCVVVTEDGACIPTERSIAGLEVGIAGYVVLVGEVSEALSPGPWEVRLVAPH